ncbi:hypothetical protein GWK47_014881 [Chionoecetes opilio]|uniref:Uncharacterized protein n=1 Tax=Chionoecetes opilio TaxID=41210 RepID=A0A8J4XSF3_CHIOP|nr:hypothetical protein GWK47_014881 [Chionoecetes opilio]
MTRRRPTRRSSRRRRRRRPTTWWCARAGWSGGETLAAKGEPASKKNLSSGLGGQRDATTVGVCGGITAPYLHHITSDEHGPASVTTRVLPDPDTGHQGATGQGILPPCSPCTQSEPRQAHHCCGHSAGSCRVPGSLFLGRNTSPVTVDGRRPSSPADNLMHHAVR